MIGEEVVFTGHIPQCPYCNKPTVREGGGMSTGTLMYYPPVYNEKGENTNPDRNTHTTHYSCKECGKSYRISGNNIDGFKYI